MMLYDHEVARNQGCRRRAAFALFFAIFIFTMSWAVSEETEKMDMFQEAQHILSTHFRKSSM